MTDKEVAKLKQQLAALAQQERAYVERCYRMDLRFEYVMRAVFALGLGGLVVSLIRDFAGTPGKELGLVIMVALLNVFALWLSFLRVDQIKAARAAWRAKGDQK